MRDGMPGQATGTVAPGVQVPGVQVPGVGAPVWRQIADEVRAAIEDGTFCPGARIPTEAAFSQRYAVNRHTIRRALEHLARDNLIRIEQGRGTFVTEDVLDYRVARETRFSDIVRQGNREPGHRVLATRRLAATAAMAQALGIAAGGAVLRVDRLMLADRKPVALGSHHFPLERLPGIVEAFRGTSSVSLALREAGVAHYERRVTRVTARLPSGHECTLLAMPKTLPVLVTEAVNVSEDGVAVEYGLTRYPTPRVQIVFEAEAA